MHWAHPERWGWLWLLPGLAAWWGWAFRARRRALARVAAPALLPHLAGSVDWAMRRLKAGATLCGIAALLLALIGPQWGFRWQQVTRRGVDLIIALDVSKSMLTEDVKPSRLARAKLAIADLADQLRGDRVGLVAFAGTAFLQCPLTVDYGALLLTLEETDADTIPRGGTALAAAIRESLRALEASSSVSRAIVIISDGESHEGDALAAAREAAQAGVPVFTIGIGTMEGELIPLVDAQGQRTFLQDRDGRTVKSRLEEVVLKDVAFATGGGYVRATPTASGLDLLYRERIANLEPREQGSAMQKQHELRFQWMLAAALLLFGLEPWLSDRIRTVG